MEIVLSIGCSIIALSALVAIAITNAKKKIEIIDVRIEEALKNIEYFLEKKEEYLEKAIELIVNANKRKYGKKNILETLIKNKNIKRDLIKKDEDLKLDLKEFYTILEEDEKLTEKKEICEVYFDSIEIENDLNASKKYYNKFANIREKEFEKFPKNILKGFLNYKKLETFNTKKEETLEILKEQEKTKNKKEKSK